VSGTAATVRPRPWKLAGKWVLAALFIVAGLSHFRSTEFFVKIMPPYLPYHRELVLISGACEVALGVLLLVPRTSRPAAWGLVALLIAVFPANLHMYRHREQFPFSGFLLFLRLPAQGLLIYWASVYTRPMIPASKTPPSSGDG
jgi:uncharacterized membrane protein